MKLTLVDKIVILSGTAILAVALACLLGGCTPARNITHGPGSVASVDSLKRVSGEVVAYKGEEVIGGYTYFYLFTADGRQLSVPLAQYVTTSVGDTVHTERNWN